MGNVCQAHISAAREHFLPDSSRGFILKRNVWMLSWRREQREAEGITQGSPGPRCGSRARPDEVNGGAGTPAAAPLLQAYGFGWRGCRSARGLQLPTRFYPNTESYRGPQRHHFLSKAKKIEGLSWAVMTFSTITEPVYLLILAYLV